jgi:hypothetical protein
LIDFANKLCFGEPQAPFVHKAYDRSSCYDNRIQNPHANFVADVITFAISFAYIAMATVLFGRRFGSWYGWVSGLAVGLFFAQGLGVLWPRRWYSDEMESRWRLF